MTNRFSVKNSIDFIDRIKDVAIEDDILVSFDVVSLFTSVLVDCAMKCIFDVLVVDDSLPTRRASERNFSRGYEGRCRAPKSLPKIGRSQKKTKVFAEI